MSLIDGIVFECGRIVAGCLWFIGLLAIGFVGIVLSGWIERRAKKLG